MEGFTRKSFTTSRSLTYTYFDSGAAANDKPALLLLHGFPDGAKLWFKVIPHLLPLGRRIIAPDLLGYGGSSNPTDAALFNSKAMTTDLAELLAAEKVEKVVVIGHDWGSVLATRMWLWQPQLCAGVAMLNVHYIPPGPFDLTAARTLDELAALEVPVTLPLAAALRAAFRVREVDADEARELSFGRPLDPRGVAGVHAAIDAAGTAVALLREEEGRARPVLVFAAAGR